MNKLQLIRTYSTPRHSSSSLHHCLQSLKRYDPVSVLQLPFWPTDSHSAFVAIHAFNSELNLIPTMVSSGTTSIAKIRYQWWRDAIESCYQSSNQLHSSNSGSNSNQIPSNHPLLPILRNAIQKHGLSKYYFTRIINGLENHYLEPRFASTNELVQFSQSTTYSTLSLLLQVLNTPTGTDNVIKKITKIPLQTIDHSLSHLSNFLAIIKLLKRLPHYLKSKQVNFIPIDLMECRDEDLFRLFSSSRTYQPNSIDLSTENLDLIRIQSVQDTLSNLLSIASHELVATREVLSLDQSHHHHDLNHLDQPNITNQPQVNKQVNKILVPDPDLMPLFLAATPAKNQIKKLEKLIYNLTNFKQKSNQNKKSNYGQIILNEFNLISKKSDWKLPFQIWFDFFVKKI